MLRPLDDHDIPDLLTIELATQEAPWSHDTFQRCFELGYDFWGIERDQKIIGFIVMSSTPLGENHILNLCVLPDCQRQGIGKELLNYAMHEAKLRNSASIMYLEVRRSNLNAIKLYQKVGFIQISERKSYYPGKNGREDALVLAKDLGVERRR